MSPFGFTLSSIKGSSIDTDLLCGGRAEPASYFPKVGPLKIPGEASTVSSLAGGDTMETTSSIVFKLSLTAVI